MRLPRPSAKAVDYACAGAIIAALVATICVLGGCMTFGPPKPPTFPAGMSPAYAEQAEFLAWQSYGRTDMPPVVRWKVGKDLDCWDYRANKSGFWVTEIDPADPDQKIRVRCDQGDTWSSLEVLVTWHGDELSFSETVLCHEYEHSLLVRQGIYVGHHERPDFFTRIDACNAVIIAGGR